MRQDEWFTGQPLCVHEPFEERAFRLRVLNFAAGSGEVLNGSLRGGDPPTMLPSEAGSDSAEGGVDAEGAAAPPSDV
jgi:hypothetical protein